MKCPPPATRLRLAATRMAAAITQRLITIGVPPCERNSYNPTGMVSRTPHFIGALALIVGPAIASAQVPAEKSPTLVEGRPVESRPPEKADDKPDFPGQTRAPYRATRPYVISTIVDGITAPWSLAFLPGGNMLVTERLPGKMRLLHPDGRLSAPLEGIAGLR